MNDTTKIRFNDHVIKLTDLIPSAGSERLVRPGTTMWDLSGDALVYAFNATNLKHQWTRATALVRQEEVQMVTVKMASGISFAVGIDHQLLAYSAGGIRLVNPLGSKRLCLPTIRRFARCFPVQHNVVAHGKSGRGGAIVSHNLPLNFRTGLFIGVLLGDGCAGQSGQLYLYGGGWKTRCRKVFADISGCGDFPYSGVTSTSRFPSQGLGGGMKSSTRTVIANERWFNFWLRDQIGSDALSKRIPGFCFDASEDHLWGLFDGLISSDGSISVSRGKKEPQLLVAFSTSSPRLVEDFKKLCERLALRCSVSPYRSKHSGRPAYIINISTKDLAKANDRYPVRFVHPGKNATFKRWIGHVTLLGPGVTGDQVPYPAELDRAFKQTYACANKFEKLASGKTNFGPFSTFKYHGHWSRETGLRYVEALQRFKSAEQVSPKYRAILCDESVGWDRVVDVTPLGTAGTAWNIVVPGADAIALEGGLLVPTFKQPVSATPQ